MPKTTQKCHFERLFYYRKMFDIMSNRYFLELVKNAKLFYRKYEKCLIVQKQIEILSEKMEK